MKFTLNEILTIIDKVKDAKLESFEYRDADVRLRVHGKRTADDRRSCPAEGRHIDDRRPAGTMRSAEIEWSAENMRPAGCAQEGETVSRIPQEAAEEKVLESPMVGIFYTAPTEGTEPFVKPGDAVKKGQTVALIEAMKLMNEIKSDWDGVVEEILAENGGAVEYGQPLLRIRTA